MADPFKKPGFTQNITRQPRRVIQIAPGLARAPRVQALLNDTYAIAKSELSAIRELAQDGRLGQDDFRRFVSIMEKLPAMLREERASDEQVNETLKDLPEKDLKELARDFLAADDGEWHGQAIEEAEEVGDPQLTAGDGEAPGGGEER